MEQLFIKFINKLKLAFTKNKPFVHEYEIETNGDLKLLMEHHDALPKANSFLYLAIKPFIVEFENKYKKEMKFVNDMSEKILYKYYKTELNDTTKILRDKNGMGVIKDGMGVNWYENEMREFFNKPLGQYEYTNEIKKVWKGEQPTKRANINQSLN